MKRFRAWRRRWAALALLAAAAITIGAGAGTATGAETARLKANKAKVEPGKKVRLAGAFEAEASTLGRSEEAQRLVRIQFRPSGSRAWRNLKRVRHDERGRYVGYVRVRRSGFYRAVHADGRTSRRERVRVKAVLLASLGQKNVNLGERLTVKGRVRPTVSRRQVTVKLGGQRLRARTNGKGRFKVRWKANRTGTVKAIAKAHGDSVAAGDRDRAGRVTVYRPAQASWYGPGFYGNRTACGQVLGTGTLGVAHKTMPCGTKLKLRHRGRTVRVEVIDRGPFHPGREFDLTGATKARLGFGSTGTVYSSK